MTSKPTRPHIVITIADDQQHNAIGKLNTLNKIHTPTLDSMIEQGTTFTNAHHFGSCHGAVCAPSRAMLHSGKNYFHLPAAMHTPEQQTPQDQQTLNTIPTLGQHLQQAGYKTYATGKWHNDTTTFNNSFQDAQTIFFGGMCDHDKVPTHTYDPTGTYAPENATTTTTFSTDLFTNSAINLINQHQTQSPEHPMFLYVAFTAPHDPRTPTPHYQNQYNPDTINLPPNFKPEHPFDNGHIYDLRDELLAPWPRDPQTIKQELANYYALITHMDHAIGQIRQTLQQHNMLNNTLFIHTGDHGLALGQHGLLGKQNMYEHSTRVPLIITGPNIPKNKRINALTYQHDLNPTLTQLTNETPPLTDFKPLWPLINNQQTKTHPHVLCSYQNQQRMIKTDRYKLIRYYQHNNTGTNQTQLFDLQNDPNELTDLSNHPQHQQTKQQLELLFVSELKKAGDPLMTELSEV